MANVIKPVLKKDMVTLLRRKFVDPIKGQYFDNPSPIDGKIFTKQQNQLKKM
jgi:aldehyde dehydrogenase (NAD+)/aldehyde dehydrogenase